MASWMKWGLGFVLGCVVLAGLILRPADSDVGSSDDELLSRRDDRWRHPVERRPIELWQEMVGLDFALRSWAAHDSAYAFLPETLGVVLSLQNPPSPRLRAAMPDAPTQLSDSGAARVAARVRAQIDSMGGSNARIALVALPSFLGSHESFSAPGYSEAIRYHAGADESGGYCLVTIGTYGLAEEDGIVEVLLHGDNPLGPCRAWARYGPPSPSVLEWLSRSGHLMDLAVPLESTPPLNRRALFGLRNFLLDDGPVGPIAAACLAGRVDACEEAALSPEAWSPGTPRTADDGLLHARLAWLWTWEPGDLGGMFAELERELGPERFAAFWRSDGDPRVALEQQLGGDFGEWVMRWGRAHYGTEPLGPRVPWTTALLSLLTIGALVGAGIAVVARRQIA